MTARPKTCWIVSELYHPEQTSTGYIMTTIAEWLAARLPEPVSVKVLCAQPTYSSRGVRAPRREVRNDTEIYRVVSTTMDKDRPSGRVVNAATIALSTFFEASRRFRPGDVVVVVTTPPTLPFTTAVACRLRRSRCVVIVHDLYPEILVAGAVVGAGSRAVRGLRTMTTAMLARVDRVLVLGRDQKERIDDRIATKDRPGPAGSERVAVVPNWADVSLVQCEPRAASTLLRQLGLADHFVIQYAGNIGRVNGLGNLLDGIELLQGVAGLHFLFVGNGARRAWLEAEVAARRLTNITVIDPVPRSRSSEVHAACDVALISLSSGMLGVSVPSRMYNIMASGRPMLAVAEPASEPARVVAEEAIGWTVPPDDPAAFAATVKAIYADPDLVKRYGSRARQVAELKYQPTMILDRYTRIVTELLSGCRT